MSLKFMLASTLAMALRNLAPLYPQAGDGAFIADSGLQMEMRPAPIDPDWILEGNPQARSSEHSRSNDGSALTALWDCTAGCFRWHFHWDETVMILEGEVQITMADGTERLLRAGDIAFFAAGTSAEWRIETYLRKIAFLRRPMPRPLAALYRLREALRGGAVPSSLAA